MRSFCVFFRKTTPDHKVSKIMFWKVSSWHRSTVLCSNFVKFCRWEIREIVLFIWPKIFLPVSQTVATAPIGMMDTSPRGHFAYWTVRLLFGHLAYWTLRLLVISPTRHFAYWTVCLLDSSPTRHFAYCLDSSPTDCSSFYQPDYQNKIKSDMCNE